MAPWTTVTEPFRALCLLLFFVAFPLSAQNMPSAESLHAALTVCAAGSTTTIDAKLVGSVKDIYAGSSAQGAAKIDVIANFLTSLSGPEKLQGYKLYTKCVVSFFSKLFPDHFTVVDSALAITRWFPERWTAVLTNPSRSRATVTGAWLKVLPNEGYGFAYPIEVQYSDRRTAVKVIEPSSSTTVDLVAFGASGDLCTNTRAVADLQAKSELSTRQCQVEVSLMSLSGQTGTATERFACSRLSLQPRPRCETLRQKR
jgi:hypothetical protein